MSRAKKRRTGTPATSHRVSQSLVRMAKSNGATEARLVSARKVAIDERVRFKCAVPMCSGYDQHLMCPPNVMSVEEFRSVLSRYCSALIVQIESPFDSSDKSRGQLTKELCDELEKETDTAEWGTRLHRLINLLEAEAFKRGFRFAAGLIGSDCALCEKCVGAGSPEPCRHPFQARPSMQALGIDVVKTCENAGLPLSLSSKNKVRWTGIVLLG